MPKVYDDWARLVRATLRREQLRSIGQRTPSDLSLASSSSSSSPFNFAASSRRLISPIKLPSPSIGEAFDYDHILRASNYFAYYYFIGHGHSGDLFFGVLDNEISVVVKRIDFSSATMEAYCLRELEFYGRASYSRFVPLLGHCSDNLNNKVFLVYKYMPNLDLASSLLRESKPGDANDDYLRSLDWITRLKIAIGVAEALSYLHHECSPPLVHRDVQARSILLDDRFEVRLGSFSEACTQEGDNHQNRITRFLLKPQEFKEEQEKSNMAREIFLDMQFDESVKVDIPRWISFLIRVIFSKWISEQGSSGSPNATCAYDVYCFGKVLLELVTGKLGISGLSDAAMKDWLEQTLRYTNINDKELVTNIVDPSLIIDEDILREVWAVAIVARSCLNPKPSRRPLMRYILKALENPLKVVGEERSSSARLRATSSRSSLNAALFGSWRHDDEDGAAVHLPTGETAANRAGAEGGSSFNEQS